MKDFDLYTKINSLPENLKKVAEDFIQSLLDKSKHEKIPLQQLRGSLKGQIEMSSDFDSPLEDFKEYME